MALVSLDFVKQALRIAERDGAGNILPHEDDGVIQGYIDTASEAVLRYLKDAADPAWDEETVPRAVRQSVIMGVQAYYDPNRQELISGLGSSDPKNPIVAMLCMMRKPTLA